LIVTTDLPESLPPIPVEVRNAAFRIATEALTNIATHSNATTAVIRVTAGASFTLQIDDNGTSDGIAWDEGFGLASMRDRTATVGGTLEAGPSPHGASVRVEFPLPNPAAVGPT
jgi:two-component system NarL family sensor kinase